MRQSCLRNGKPGFTDSGKFLHRYISVGMAQIFIDNQNLILPFRKVPETSNRLSYSSGRIRSKQFRVVHVCASALSGKRRTTFFPFTCTDTISRVNILNSRYFSFSTCCLLKFTLARNRLYRKSLMPKSGKETKRDKGIHCAFSVESSLLFTEAMRTGAGKREGRSMADCF